ncbi:hypothetical protein YC2023_077250 [Brassica napus]
MMDFCFKLPDLWIDGVDCPLGVCFGFHLVYLYAVHGMLSTVVVDQAASWSVSKNFYLPVYEGLVVGSLRCFLRVLGGGGLAVVWPRCLGISLFSSGLADHGKICIVFCPLICLIMAIGNSAIILGLLPVHGIWTLYSISSAKQLGPILKLFLCLCLPLGIILWVVVSIVGSVLGGAVYGFLSPIFATFDAVGEGKSNPLFHCFYDGTWSTVKGCFTVVCDFRDVCFHSYFSFMDDLRTSGADRHYYEIRLLQIPGAVIAAVLGVIVDFPMISLIALFKSPYMLFKGWRRLFHDLIGREGPFLETMCVPIAGLVILLWPLGVVGAVLGSLVSSVFLGAYAGVVSYQESSFFFGLCYVVASLSIYDEYSNDVLDMPEGSCFPRPKFRRKEEEGGTGGLSRPNSFKTTPSRGGSNRGPMIDLKPLDLLEALFEECRKYGETMLLRSIKSNSTGLLLGDGVTEITTRNRPKDAFFDWFLNPFLIIKDQIEAANLSEQEEEHLGKLVLLFGDSERLKRSITESDSPHLTELRKAELDSFARRLQGLTKSVSRYPTFRRHFVELVKKLSNDLDKKHNRFEGGGRSRPVKKTVSRIFSQKSFKQKTSSNGSDHQDSPNRGLRDIDIVFILPFVVITALGGSTTTSVCLFVVSSFSEYNGESFG